MNKTETRKKNIKPIKEVPSIFVSCVLFTSCLCIMSLPRFSFSSVRPFDAHPAFSRHVIKSATCSARFQKKKKEKEKKWNEKKILKKNATNMEVLGLKQIVFFWILWRASFVYLMPNLFEPRVQYSQSTWRENYQNDLNQLIKSWTVESSLNKLVFLPPALHSLFGLKRFTGLSGSTAVKSTPSVRNSGELGAPAPSCVFQALEDSLEVLLDRARLFRDIVRDLTIRREPLSRTRQPFSVVKRSTEGLQVSVDAPRLLMATWAASIHPLPPKNCRGYFKIGKNPTGPRRNELA